MPACQPAAKRDGWALQFNRFRVHHSLHAVEAVQNRRGQRLVSMDESNGPGRFIRGVSFAAPERKIGDIDATVAEHCAEAPNHTRNVLVCDVQQRAAEQGFDIDPIDA